MTTELRAANNADQREANDHRMTRSKSRDRKGANYADRKEANETNLPASFIPNLVTFAAS